MKLLKLLTPLVVLSAAAGSPGAEAADPQVELKTSFGTIVLELYPAKAPKTVENFLSNHQEHNHKLMHRIFPHPNILLTISC